MPGLVSETETRDTTGDKAQGTTNAPLLSTLPTSADLAEEYLRARGLGPTELRLRKHRGEWLRCNGTYYEPQSYEALEADVTTYFNGTPYRAKVSTSFVSGIIKQLTARCLMPEIDLPAEVIDGAWKPARDVAVLKNGVVTLASVQSGQVPDLQPHSSRLVTRRALSFDYDSAATCRQWLTFLEHVLPDDGSRRLLQQIFGYCLTFDMRYQKFFLFEGTGGNGKSVVTSILRRIIGDHNTSSLPLNRFGDKHGLANTHGKLVNFTGELREKDTVAEELLKQATGGDVMHFDPKYKSAFTAPFTAKIIICTNERPTFTDRSDGLWRRLVVLPFPVSIPPEQQDPGLEARLARESPGILNWAIQGAIALTRAGRFEEPARSKAAAQDFRDQASPERIFLKERCRLEESGWIEAQALYDEYRADAHRGGFKPMNKAKFRKEVLLLPGVKEDRLRKANGSRPHIFRGITTSPEGSNVLATLSLSEAGSEGADALLKLRQS